jgi:hypothetical protein
MPLSAKLCLLARLEVVVAQDADHGQLDRRRQFAEEQDRFVGLAIVGQVAAQHHEVRVRGDLRQDRLEAPLGVFGEVHVSQSHQPNFFFRWHAAPAPREDLRQPTETQTAYLLARILRRVVCLAFFRGRSDWPAQRNSELESVGKGVRPLRNS